MYGAKTSRSDVRSIASRPAHKYPSRCSSSALSVMLGLTAALPAARRARPLGCLASRGGSSCRLPACAAGAAWQRAVGLFGGRRWRGRISGRARGVAVASTLFLAARRAAQLTFPCGAFVFFLGAFDSILVLMTIVRE